MEIWEKYVTKMKTILENDDITGNDAGFVESVMEWVNDAKTITKPQIKSINKVEHNLSDDADWKKYDKICTDIIDHPKCTDIGYDTATGIQSYINDKHFITPGQMTALDNVMNFLEN